MPADLAKHTLTLPFNDLAAVEKLFAERGGTIAAVIVEPVVGQHGRARAAARLPPGVPTLCRSTARSSSWTR